jgi:hypothetical protein
MYHILIANCIYVGLGYINYMRPKGQQQNVNFTNINNLSKLENSIFNLGLKLDNIIQENPLTEIIKIKPGYWTGNRGFKKIRKQFRPA